MNLEFQSAEKGLYFPNRIPEDHIMTPEDEKAFNDFMKANFERIFGIFADEFLEKTGFKIGSLIEFACGAGMLAHAISQRAPELSITGIDVSERMVEEARKECEGLPNVTFQVADVSHTGLPDASFDAVVSKDSFHEFEKPLEALKEMIRVVKPGGWVCVQDLRRDMPMEFLQMVLPQQNPFQKLQYQSARAAHTPDEIKEFLTRLGIKENSVGSREVTPAVRERYASIPEPQLLAGFLTRYTLWFAKPV